MKYGYNGRHIDLEEQLLNWVEVDPADLLQYQKDPDPFMEIWGFWDVITFRGCDEIPELQDFARDHEGEKGAFVQGLSRKIETKLRSEREAFVQEGSLISWNIPAVNMVHLGTASKMRKLFALRDLYWRTYREREKREMEFGVPVADRIIPARPGTPRWGPAGYEDDMEAWREIGYEGFKSD
ncbi:hypothetical protein G7Y89_g5272 [Cudoniella acicularis]|uniref:Uncharacterized protein n=1 Tax=Cudoniella acicularis TaxID=354080 RepID=A0A8H4W454_9HELO|nr:hypothetical protein G7Y89_g5272 [Cudoniella acicularis]